jgi:hypothetical protein
MSLQMPFRLPRLPAPATSLQEPVPSSATW